MVEDNENDQSMVYENGKNLLELLVAQLPGRSISFLMDEPLYESVEALIGITEDKLPKNMPKIQAAALESLNSLLEQQTNNYVNMNLSKEDIKALAKVLEYVEREL